jgi:hypothetical protein
LTGFGGGFDAAFASGFGTDFDSALGFAAGCFSACLADGWPPVALVDAGLAEGCFAGAGFADVRVGASGLTDCAAAGRPTSGAASNSAAVLDADKQRRRGRPRPRRLSEEVNV